MALFRFRKELWCFGFDKKFINRSIIFNDTGKAKRDQRCAKVTFNLSFYKLNEPAVVKLMASSGGNVGFPLSDIYESLAIIFTVKAAETR